MTRLSSQGGPPGWFRWVTRISLGIGLIALVATIWKVGVGTLLGHLYQIGPWFALLFAIELLVSVCDAGVIYALTRGPGAPNVRQIAVAQLAGRAVNSVTPGATLGEALRVTILAGARGCSTQRVLAAVMFAAIGALVFGLAVVAGGSIVTALVFALPGIAELALLAVGATAGAIAIGVVLLVRRGMVSELARLARRLRLISHARHERWRDQLANLDRRLRGEVQSEQRRALAIVLLVISQTLQRLVIWLTLLAAGYSLAAPQLIAVLSAGVVLSWVASLVPMGIGVAEGGNGALFALIGAPTSLGVALALAKRVNQIVFAVLGFSVLAADRIANHVQAELLPRPEHVVVR